MISRRAVLAGLVSQGQAEPMRGMMAIGVIARRGDGALALKQIEGQALSGGRLRAFAFDDPFRVASISKMITATALMRLAPDLDADVSDILGARLRHPFFPDAPVTLRRLLSHTSGLRNGKDFPVLFGRALLGVLADRTGGWWGAEPPGFFSYSDVNYGLVAQIIERIAGARFDLHMTRTMLAPLGLDIGYNWSGVSQPRRDRAAAGCRSVDGRWTPDIDGEIVRAPTVAIFRAPEAANLTEADYRLGENGLAFSPHGGLRLSLADLDRLAQLYVRGEALLPRAQLEVMMKPAWVFDGANGNTEGGFYQSFGLGVHAPAGEGFFGPATRDWRGHFGDAYGWMTGLFWNVRDGCTIAWAINGMPESGRPRGVRAPLTAPEEAVIDLALAAF
ncbi:MAG: serine hydrolase [Hyphomonadaceae bacterium]|nr:serine hydrolase [Hyphomonadaceae bacterium]